MGTFTEFYIALLKFVNFKLFRDLGMPYPEVDLPITASTYYDAGKVRDIQNFVRKLFKNDQEDVEMESEFKDNPEMLKLNQR